ncbi:MAG TPA: nucleotidyltransferase family protein [Saprospiraceae bacterium]|nr:nucleotidyltransferase family protein [Saprospiraceae bacterium]
MNSKTAMIFAAGLGTRLRPLTLNKPKAMVEVNGIPLLERAILKLKKDNFRRLIINIHHFGHQILDFLQEKNNFGIEIIISDEREQILETGGGLLKAMPLLGDNPFLVYNVDIITNNNLEQLYNFRLQTDGLATLAVRKRATSRYLLFDENNVLSGWKNIKTNKVIFLNDSNRLQQWAFSGIHVIDPKIFEYMPSDLSKFSIIDTYLTAGKNEKIIAFPHDEDYWWDVGKPEKLQEAAEFLTKKS